MAKESPPDARGHRKGDGDRAGEGVPASARPPGGPAAVTTGDKGIAGDEAGAAQSPQGAKTLQPLVAPSPSPSPSPPSTPFAALDDEWESELAAWDAAIPVVNRAALDGGRSSRSGAPKDSGRAGESGGAIPTDENPFRETPITVVGPAQLLDLEDVPDMFSAGTFDDGLAPASGSYAALVATDQSVPGVFDRDPSVEPPPSFPVETLREMSARPWSDDLASLITLGPSRSESPPRAYWETLATIINEERAVTRDDQSARLTALGLAAARVDDELGNSAQARAHLEAVLEIDSSSPAAHRARLILAERAGPVEDDAATESLARLAFTSHADQPYYRALYAEWALSRAARGFNDGAVAAAVASIPEGLARLLAEAELAWANPSAAASLVESAGHRVGGALGAALLLCAAGLNERAQDFQTAAEQRFVAARLEEQRPLLSLGGLRDLARLEPGTMVPALEEILGRLPPSALKVAVARWGAAASARAGDRARAWRLVSSGAKLGPPTPALARDRLDLWPGVNPTQWPGDDPHTASTPSPQDADPAENTLAALTAAAWAACGSPLARTCVAVRTCALAVTEDELAFALETAERAVADAADAPALAMGVQRVAGRTSDRATRLRALRLWRALDGARWTAASLQLLDSMTSSSSASPTAAGADAEAAQAIVREIALRDPSSPAFWSLATEAAARGDFSEASAALEQGRERAAWRGGPLATALAELGCELMARVDPSTAASRLAALSRKMRADGPSPTVDAAAVLGLRLTRGRVLRALGDRDLWAEYVEDEIAAQAVELTPEATDMQWRAALLLEPVFWPGEQSDRAAAGSPAPRPAARGEAEDVPALVAAALDAVPLHPAALALALGASPDPAMLVDRLAAGASGPAGARWLLGAAVAAAVAGDGLRALNFAQRARDASAAQSGGPEKQAMTRAIGATMRRLARMAPDNAQRAALLRGLADDDGSADALVEAADATEAEAAATNDPALNIQARRLFEAAAFASGDAAVAADVRLGLERLTATATQQEIPPVAVAKREESDRRRDRDRLRLLEGSARAQRWDDVVTSLLDTPPHEDKAGAQILALAAALDEGRGSGNRAQEIWVRARAALALADSAGDANVPMPTRPPGAASTVTAARPSPAGELTALLRAGGQSDADADADAPAHADPGEAGAALERLAEAAGRVPDERSAALLLIEAARLAASLDQARTTGAEERCLRAAVSVDPSSVPAAIAWRRWLLRAGRAEEAARAWGAEAEALVAPGLRVQALVRAAALLAPQGDDAESGRHEAANADAPETQRSRLDQAAAFLERALAIDPDDHSVFVRLRALYEESGRHTALAQLLATRLTVTSNPFEATALRLARADIFADALQDRARAKQELEAILQKEPQHARALARLADLEQEEGNDARVADLLIRRAFVERSPEKLRDLFLRLGRIYTQSLPDPKRAVGAYARVLQLDPNSREALDELSGLYVGLGETKSAIAITERLVRIETVPESRSRYNIRLAHLAERAGDPRAAAAHFRRAAEEAPRSVEAIGEFVRHLDKVRDTVTRRAYLDHAASDLRVAVFASPGDASALQALMEVLRWRGRSAAAASAAELLAMSASKAVTVGESGSSASVLPAWAAPPAGGRRLAALVQPAVDEETFPPTVPPSVRHLFRMLVPVFSETGKVDLGRYRIDRGDRIASGRAPRDLFESVGAELAAGPFDLYVAPAAGSGRGLPMIGATPVVLAVEPGKPAAVIVGAALMALGPAALRFAAGRSLRLLSTHLDVALAGDAEDLGIWIGGVVRQFVSDYSHPLLPAPRLSARAARVAKLLPKRLRQEIMPFAMESSGQLDLPALHAGIRDGANRVGLLACGSLEAALRVVSLIGAARQGANGLDDMPLAALTGQGEAQALLEFALSDAYDDLARSLE